MVLAVGLLNVAFGQTALDSRTEVLFKGLDLIVLEEALKALLKGCWSVPIGVKCFGMKKKCNDSLGLAFLIWKLKKIRDRQSQCRIWIFWLRSRIWLEGGEKFVMYLALFKVTYKHSRAHPNISNFPFLVASKYFLPLNTLRILAACLQMKVRWTPNTACYDITEYAGSPLWAAWQTPADAQMFRRLCRERWYSSDRASLSTGRPSPCLYEKLSFRIILISYWGPFGHTWWSHIESFEVALVNEITIDYGHDNSMHSTIWASR